MSWRRRILLGLVIAIAAAAAPHGSRPSSLSIFLWAWETPTDLRELGSSRAGVAFLADSLTLRGDEVVERLRRQSLLVAEGTRLVAAVRIDIDRTLPPPVGLSMTALASWCVGDPWIAGLPVDEAVPMLFRMGPDSRRVRQDLASGRDVRVSLCRRSVGFSTDEPLRWRPAGRRIYLFNPRGWNAASALEALSEYGR